MRFALRFAAGTTLALVLTSGCAQVTSDESDSALMCATAANDPITEQTHGFAAPVPIRSRPIARTVSGTRVVYLNRDARTYVAGIDDAQSGSSSVVSARGLSRSSISGFKQGDDAWKEIVSCIREEYSRFDIAVTDIRPVTPGYIEAHFGGSGPEIGITDGSGGIAPIDSTSCSVVEGAVAFVFTDLFGKNYRSICEVGAHEIGHPFSLDHVFDCQDPMTYLEGCGEKEFQADDQACGESKARPCNCNRPSQNTVSILLQQIGARTSDLVPPTVELLAPVPDPLGGGTYVQIRAHDPNGALAAIELHIATGNSELVAVCGDGTMPCTLDQELASFALPISSGDQLVWAVAEDTNGNRTSSLEAVIPAVPAQATTLALAVAPIASRYSAGDVVEIQAIVVAEDPIAEAVVVWQDGSGATRELPLCPTLAASALEAVVSTRLGNDNRAETRYGVSMQLGGGNQPRSFYLRVTDTTGRVTRSAEESVPFVAE